MGRAVLRAVSSLDGRALPPEPPGTYLSGRRQLIPGWSIALVAAVLLLPALVTVADGFARVGRRRGRVRAWVVWTVTGALPFAAAYVLLRLLDLIGVVPGMSVATAPDAAPLTAWGVALMGVLGFILATVWRFGRRAVVRRVRGLSPPSHPGAAAAVALVVCVGVLVLWVINPLAALFFVPAVHLWSGAAVAARPRVGLVLVMAGLVLPLAAAVFYLERLSLDPISSAWYWLLLLSGGEVSVAAAVIACVLAGAFLSLLAVLAARVGQDAAAPPPALVGQRLRAPATYVGPGSLGRTRSALRR
jgi:hypothetical protein